MKTTTRTILATAMLSATLAAAQAQTTDDHNAHHPDAQTLAQNPAAPTPAPQTSPAARPGQAGGMMGGDMGRMMPEMMRGMMGQGMMPMGTMAGGGMDGMQGPMGMAPFEHVEGRIAFFRAELGITDAQLPQWNAVADTMRANAKAMRDLLEEMARSGPPATAPDRVDRQIRILTARLNGLKAMETSGKALYAVLSDEQKKKANALMASPMGRM